MATLLERLSFLQKVPTLMRATADDESPCPGYLFEEISKISHESVGCCQCLLEYLLERLQVESYHVKLKVLKILLHLCNHGPPHFRTELRRNATFIQEVIVYSGPPDPIHGNAPFQKVRSSAQELASLLFNDTMSPDSGLAPCRKVTISMGMGSESLRSGMQGFGYSPGKTESSGTTLLDKIQRAAEVVASAVLPPAEHPGIRLHDNLYHAVVAPSATVEIAVPACAYNIQSHGHRASHRCPGQAGGGWEETDSSHSSSHNSSQENVPVSQTSVGRSSKSGGSGSNSGASRESGDLAERVEAMQLGDCGQEMALINILTSSSKVFLSREESQHFIKECSTLNCEVVVELLSGKLQDHSQTVQMRALCALSCLMSSDFLSLDHIFNITHKRLVQLSEGTAGPVANKATKLLRQFEALLGYVTHPRCDPAGRSVSSSSSLSEQPSKSLTNLLLPGQLGETATSVIPSESPPSRDPPQANISEPMSQIKGEQEERRERNSSKIPEPSRLSLFSGMELVNRSKPVCLVEPVPVEIDVQTGVEAMTDTDCTSEKSSERTIESPASSRPEQCKEQMSAFSFLNL